MSLLEQYEEQYAALVAETTSHIARANLLGGKERRELGSKIDANLAEAAELLEQMSLEVCEIDVTQRSISSSKLSCAQIELKRLEKEYRGSNDSTIALNSAGAYYHDDVEDDVSIGTDQRQRLLENSERIERTGNRLTEGYRVALETEQVGTQVLSDLHHQREVLHGARSRLRETNADLGRASRTLNTMMLRALREKAVLYAVGFCFVVAVGISLYLTFSSSSNAPAA